VIRGREGAGDGSGATHELSTDVNLVKENPEVVEGGGGGRVGCFVRVTRVDESGVVRGGDGARKDQVGEGARDFPEAGAVGT